ncbi:MAG TPA: hypothetical protein VGJ81_02700 [Thermoanaerobaculia bacterium]
MTAFPVAATVRFTDFEAPVKTTYSQPSLYEDYNPPNTADEVRFSRGYRAAAIPTWTSSTTYFNWNGQDEVEIYFSVPVKNISFKMYGFYNDTRGRAASIQYTSKPYDPAPAGTLAPDPILYYAPTSGPTTVTVPADGIRYMTVYYGGQPFAIDDFSFDDGPAYDYTVTGQILDGSPQETKHLAAETTVYAQVPLGLELKLALLNNGSPAPAQFVLAPAVLDGLATPTLYPTNAVLEYDRDTTATTKTFRAVHIGTQTLYVNPGLQTPVVKVTVGVFDPGSLGDNGNVDYDSMIVTWGNRRGIPPHVLKGLILQETGKLNPLEYRYEPLTGGGVGDYYIHQKVASEPYRHYRLATDSGLAKGDSLFDFNAGDKYLVDDDVSPRKVFVLPRAQDGAEISIRPMDACPDLCVSAREIFENNDKTSAGTSQNWSAKKNAGSTNWWDAQHLSMLEFTAQTPLAASYGLMQIMYPTAVETYNWAIATQQQNPSYLFDTPENVKTGGGSLAPGTMKFYDAYDDARDNDWIHDPNFADSDDYKDLMIAAMNWYNHGSQSVNTDYGDKAWALGQKCSPSHQQSKIFP